MKSSKDIEPRVGMQYRYFNRNYSQKIRYVRNGSLGINGDFHHPDYKFGDWCEGNIEIEWIPPTDEERKMFVDFADDYNSIPRSELFYVQCTAFLNCFRSEVGTKDCVALSLALDGADYDNMPEGFE